MGRGLGGHDEDAAAASPLRTNPNPGCKILEPFAKFRICEASDIVTIASSLLSFFPFIQSSTITLIIIVDAGRAWWWWYVFLGSPSPWAFE